MPRPATAQPALTFQLENRRYALALDRTAGVRDLGTIRHIPNAPKPWFGLTDWGNGRVLNVLDLPALLEDRGTEAVQSIVRLRAPHEDLALFIPAHIGLAEFTPPTEVPNDAVCVPLSGGPDSIHWICVDALTPLAQASA